MGSLASTPKMNSCRAVVLIVLLGVLTAVGAVLLEVPGYATVEGDIHSSYHTERPFNRFRGLYYGAKPNASTRFLPPVPFTPNPNEIYNATNEPEICTQWDGFGGSEDCLLLNIGTPKLPGNASDPNTSYDNLLPVIFWVHGGAFSVGEAPTYSIDKYMDRDVVLVSVQYRLGPFGFMSLNTDEIPGNAGIFDQIEALRWVNKFIKYFGGDPDCVTIAGQSAGSASVSALMLAPQARGLFHRVIGQSGSILNPWAIDRDPVGHAMRIARLAGCPAEPYSALLFCLRNVPYNALTLAYAIFGQAELYDGLVPFGGSTPVIQVAGAERVLEREPIEMMESGDYNTDVPILFGTTKQEGVLVLGVMYYGFLIRHGLIHNETYLANNAVPDFLKALGIADETGELAEALTEKFFDGLEMGNFRSMIPGMIDLGTVLFFKETCHQKVITHSKFNPNSYFYYFTYDGRFSLCRAITPPGAHHGVCHGDDLIYMFDYPTFGHNETEAVMSEQMLDVWTTFAKYGNPTPDGVKMMEGIPKFLPITEEDDNYMEIDEEWTIKYNFSLTYTATLDEMKEHNGDSIAALKYN